jgi:hypothetical protein
MKRSVEKYFGDKVVLERGDKKCFTDSKLGQELMEETVAIM